MIRINLLPHRELRRERRKKDFVGLAIIAAMMSAGIAFLVGQFINNQVAQQVKRNEFVQARNAELEKQIKEVETLESDIRALQARQTAVENLQSDRTLPVHLFDELVKHVPEGVYLKLVKQDDMKVTLSGVAQSNERVSELLRNLAYNTPWLEKPELQEIKAIAITPVGSKEPKRAFDFSLNAMLKRPSKPGAKPGEEEVPKAKTTDAQVGAAQVAAK
jgi:type IV pilus assembly protein PilN